MTLLLKSATVDPEIIERAKRRRRGSLDWSRVSESEDGDQSQVYTNPDLALFMQRQSSRQHYRRRSSLAELIPDWPELDVVGKPQFRMSEVMLNCENPPSINNSNLVSNFLLLIKFLYSYRYLHKYHPSVIYV